MRCWWSSKCPWTVCWVLCNKTRDWKQCYHSTCNGKWSWGEGKCFCCVVEGGAGSVMFLRNGGLKRQSTKSLNSRMWSLTGFRRIKQQGVAVCLTNTLWMIDGYHKTLADRDCHVPDVLSTSKDITSQSSERSARWITQSYVQMSSKHTHYRHSL